MNLSGVAELLWAAGFVGHAALLAILLVRHRWKHFPVFTAYMAFQAVWSPILYVVYAHGPGWYARVYWSGALLDFIGQLGIVHEIARNVMKPTGTWLRDARKQFIFGATFGILLAGTLAWIVAPPSARAIDRLEMKSDLFAAFLVCELLLVISTTARRMGLGWRNHVIAISFGFAAWIVVAVLTETLRGYYGRFHYFSAIEYTQQFTYLGALGFWMVQLWRPEPARRPISPELRDYIVALHRRVEYDLGELESR